MDLFIKKHQQSSWLLWKILINAIMTDDLKVIGRNKDAENFATKFLLEDWKYIDDVLTLKENKNDLILKVNGLQHLICDDFNEKSSFSSKTMIYKLNDILYKLLSIEMFTKSNTSKYTSFSNIINTLASQSSDYLLIKKPFLLNILLQSGAHIIVMRIAAFTLNSDLISVLLDYFKRRCNVISNNGNGDMTIKNVDLENNINLNILTNGMDSSSTSSSA